MALVFETDARFSKIQPSDTNLRMGDHTAFGKVQASYASAHGCCSASYEHAPYILAPESAQLEVLSQ